MALAGGRTGERGSVAVLVALALAVLLGFAALVVDVGLLWAVRAEAQTAADAAALAGAARLADGPAGTVAAVRHYLDANVPGLADRPADPNWPLNGADDDGEVVCWTPPAPGAGCPAGATAVQVTTPPIPVKYAFASVLGPDANAISALAAATTGGLAGTPGLPCGLCLLDPVHSGYVVVEAAASRSTPATPTPSPCRTAATSSPTRSTSPAASPPPAAASSSHSPPAPRRRPTPCRPCPPPTPCQHRHPAASDASPSAPTAPSPPASTRASRSPTTPPSP
jgi:hypothetical protein